MGISGQYFLKTILHYESHEAMCFGWMDDYWLVNTNMCTSIAFCMCLSDFFFKKIFIIVFEFVFR